MARFLDLPPGPLAAPALLTPRERVALERAPRQVEDPKRARAREGGAGFLMDMISGGEGTSGPAGYDQIYGDKPGKPLQHRAVTEMTFGDVDQLQQGMLKRRGGSSAIGKYQFLRGTRADVQGRLGANDDQVATEGMQDRMMREFLNTLGYDKFVSGRMSAPEFQSSLAHGFASLAPGPDDKIRLPNGRVVDARVRTADIQRTLKAAKAEHDRFLRTDPYITQRIEEGYMPDVTRWR
jgi:muramidase (phage lysozyme)